MGSDNLFKKRRQERSVENRILMTPKANSFYSNRGKENRTFLF